MRYSAIWLSMCWAATMCCPSWLVWIYWAGPDGLLKALPYGILEPLYSPYRHAQTLNCYSCYCDWSVLLFILIILAISESLCCATQQNVWFRRSVLHSLLKVLPVSHWMSSITVFPCIQWPFFVIVFNRCMCNWDRMFPVEHKVVHCHYQQLMCWFNYQMLSLPQNNVKHVNNDWFISWLHWEM